jgi:hypothetical protein
MVMDIRDLRDEEAELDGVEEVEEQTPGLLEWLDACATTSDPSERARLITQLRLCVPSEEGLSLLREVVASGGRAQALLAAQVLGHHRPWLSTPAGVRQQVALAQGASDPSVVAALVWGLRQRDEAAEFIVHSDSAVAREAALAAPVSRRTLSPILAGLRAGIRPEVERILLHKLHQIHPSLVRYLVDLLVEGSWGEEALRGLFASLPQMSLFELFVDSHHPASWAVGDAEGALLWQRMVRLASSALVDRPGSELLRHLLSRSGDDEAFARRHGAFLRDAVRRADVDLGADLVGHVERLTFGASEDKVARLAQSLVDLSARLDGAAVDKMHSLLEEWKRRSADLKLKIYHLEQGIG